jgi:two-component system NtrC family sensor kinase
VAVKQRRGVAQWLIRATIDFASFNTLVENLHVGRTGTAFILNRQGEFQTRPPRDELKPTKQQYLNPFKNKTASHLSDVQNRDGLCH